MTPYQLEKNTPCTVARDKVVCIVGSLAAIVVYLKVDKSTLARESFI